MSFLKRVNKRVFLYWITTKKAARHAKTSLDADSGDDNEDVNWRVRSGGGCPLGGGVARAAQPVAYLLRPPGRAATRPAAAAPARSLSPRRRRCRRAFLATLGKLNAEFSARKHVSNNRFP